MSDETTKAEEETNRKGTETSAQLVPNATRFDEEGLPLDREPTMDDVRGGEGSERTIAIGCSILVIVAIAAFWLIRARLLG